MTSSKKAIHFGGHTKLCNENVGCRFTNLSEYVAFLVKGPHTVVYFDQLLGAARTQKLVETYVDQL